MLEITIFSSRLMTQTCVFTEEKNQTIKYYYLANFIRKEALRTINDEYPSSAYKRSEDQAKSEAHKIVA